MRVGVFDGGVGGRGSGVGDGESGSVGSLGGSLGLSCWDFQSVYSLSSSSWPTLPRLSPLSMYGMLFGNSRCVVFGDCNYIAMLADIG